MANFSFSDEDRKRFHKERFEHPHPRVQQRMEVLWLISQGLVYLEVARLAGVSGATVGLFAGARHRMGHHPGLRKRCCRFPPPQPAEETFLQFQPSILSSKRFAHTGQTIADSPRFRTDDCHGPPPCYEQHPKPDGLPAAHR